MSSSHSLRNLLQTLLLLCLLVLPSGAYGSNYYFDTAIVRDSSIVCGRLDNGISYFVVPNKYSGAKIDLYMMVASGSADENMSQSGYAHLLEHLIFESKDENGSSIHKRLSALGKSIGNGYNAITNFDVTRFDVYDIEREDLAMIENCMDILADMCRGLELTPNSLNHEIDVVCNEFNPSLEKAIRSLMCATFPEGSVYYNRTNIGTTASVRAASVESIKDYYATRFAPAEKAIVIVGDIDPSLGEKLIRLKFGDIPACGPTAGHYEPFNHLDREHYQTVFAPVANSESHCITLNIICDRLQRADRHLPENDALAFEAGMAYAYLNIVLSAMTWNGTLPMYAELDSDLSTVLGVSTPRAFTATLSIHSPKWDEVYRPVRLTLERLRRDGCTEEEFNLLKKKIEAATENYNHYHIQTNAELADEFTKTLNNGETYTSDEQDKQILSQMLDMSRDELNVILRRILSPENVQFCILLDPADIPAKGINHSEYENITVDRTDTAINEAMAMLTENERKIADTSALDLSSLHIGTMPSPPASDESSRTVYTTEIRDSMLGVTTPLYISRTSMGDNHVRVQAIRKGGIADIVDILRQRYPSVPADSLWLNASLCNSIPLILLWGRLSQSEFSSLCQIYDITLSAGCTLTDVTVTAEGNASRLPLMLALINELTSRPYVPASATFKRSIDDAVAYLVADEQTLSSKVTNEIMRMNFGSNPVVGYTSPDRYFSCSPEIAAEAARLAYGDGRRYAYIIDGDIDSTANYKNTAAIFVNAINQLPAPSERAFDPEHRGSLPSYRNVSDSISIDFKRHPGISDTRIVFIDARRISGITGLGFKPADGRTIAALAAQQLLDKLRIGNSPVVYDISVDCNYDYSYDAFDFTVFCFCQAENITTVTSAVDAIIGNPEFSVSVDDSTTNALTDLIYSLDNEAGSPTFIGNNLRLDLLYGMPDSSLSDFKKIDPDRFISTLSKLQNLLSQTPAHRIFLYTGEAEQ